MKPNGFSSEDFSALERLRTCFAGIVSRSSGLYEQELFMRTLLSVKWSVILTIMGVSFITLTGLMFLNQRETRRALLRDSHMLLEEAASLEAARYVQIGENISAVLNAISTVLQSGLDLAVQKGYDPDPARLSGFMKTTLDNSRLYLRALGIVLNPDVFFGEHASFENRDGFFAIKYLSTRGSRAEPVPSQDVINATLGSNWWKKVKETKQGLISEPYLSSHVITSGMHTHVEIRFVQPILRGGEFLGVVWSEICLTDFQKTLQQVNENERIVGLGTLISPSGSTIGIPPDYDVTKLIVSSDNPISKIDVSYHEDIMQAVREARPFSETVEVGANNTRVLVATHQIDRIDMGDMWSVMRLRLEDDVWASSTGSLERHLRQTLAMLAISGLLGYLATKIIGRTLVRNEEWYRTILNRIPIPVGLLDSDSKWVYANPAIARVLLLGEPENMYGRGAHETMSAGEASFVSRTNRPNAPDIENLEITVLGNRQYDVASCRVADTDDKYIGRLVVGMDVTDARNIAKTLGLATTIARNLDTKSDRILSAAQSLSESAMEKSAAIEEITSTTQKIGESAATYASSARNSLSQAEATHSASDRGALEAQAVASAMGGVRESGQNIRKIIKLIDDIAFQTNLLSLNAAVEAARAGRNGKGFAVVAGEVRNLAGRSAKAAQETSLMITEMTNRIGDATQSIEQLASTLVEIRDNSDNLRVNSNEVAHLAEQQSHSVQQVHVTLEQISKSVDSTIVISRGTAEIAESLMEQAAALRRITETGDTGSYQARARKRKPRQRQADPLSRNAVQSEAMRRLTLPYEEQE